MFVLCVNWWNSVRVLAGTLECTLTACIWHGKVFLISTVLTYVNKIFRDQQIRKCQTPIPTVSCVWSCKNDPVIGRKLNSAATSTSCAPYNSVQESSHKRVCMDNFLGFPNHSTACPNPSNLAHDNLTNTTNGQPPESHYHVTVLWPQHVFIASLRCLPPFHNVRKDYDYLFAQIEGELNIQNDSYDSLRTYIDYDILWHLHVVVLPTKHTPCTITSVTMPIHVCRC